MIRNVLLLVALALAPAARAQEPVPVADFVRQDDIISAKISPGGEYVALHTRLGEQTGIFVIDLATMTRTGAMVFGRGGFPHDFYWVGPRRFLAELATGFGPLDQPYLTGELFAMDADDANRKYLFGYRGKKEEMGTRLNKGATYEDAWARVIDPLPHDPLHALIEVRPFKGYGGRKDASPLYAGSLPLFERLNVVSGARERVGTSPVFDPEIVADAAGVPRLVTGMNNEGYPETWSRSSANGAWVRMTLPGGAGLVQPLAVSRNGASAYLSSPQGSAPACLREYRFETRELVQVSCGNADPHPVFAPSDGRPIAVRYEDGLPKMEYPDPDHPDARLLRSLQKSFPGQRLSNISYSLDGNRMVVLVDNDRSPGDYYIVTRTSKKVDLLFPRKNWIDPARMQAVEPVAVKARDGVIVPGYLTARDGVKTRKAPLVVVPHAGPHGRRDYWQWNADVQLLASRGYAVLQVNYRGSGGYGEAFQAAGYQKWGTLMQDDITDAVRWTIAEGIADPARICIYGSSYGGYAALMSATREPELYRCVITLNGIYDLVEQVADTNLAESWLGRSYLERAVGSGAAALREQSPIAHVASLKAPVLIAHGTSNVRIPFSQAKALRAALEAGKNPYEWMEFAGEEHGFWKAENHAAFYERMLTFLDQHIGAGAKK